MQSLVGIIRTEVELKQALTELGELQERATKVGVEGHRQYNPGWHLSIDLRAMLAVSEAVATAALERKESRGGHTRDDYPGPDPAFGMVNVRVRRQGDGVAVDQIPLPQMPDDLKELFEEGH
jgi:succinate dehydrogenase / fumarate reductase flavoprotein subunit